MPALISAGTAASIRRVFNSMMSHTYTLTPYTSGPDDGYGSTPTPGTPVSGKKCSYRQQRQLRFIDGTRLTIDTPTLTVPHDDPIKVGDEVSNVRDTNGVMLMAGAATVEVIEPSAGLGPTLQKRALLRGGDAV